MRVGRASALGLFLVLAIVSAGCLSFFPSDNSSPSGNETGLTAGSVGEKRILIEPVSTDEIVGETTTQYSDTFPDERAVLANGTLVTTDRVDTDDAFLYNGTVYQINEMSVGERTQYVVSTRLVVMVDAPETYIGTRFSELPRVDREKLRPLFESGDEQAAEEEARNPSRAPDTISVSRIARYSASNATESAIVNGSSRPIVYTDPVVPRQTTLYLSTAVENQTVYRYTREPFASNESYASTYLTDHAVNVSLNSSEATTFDKIRAFDGNVSVSSLRNESLVRTFERRDETNEFHYTGGSERTWFVERNGQVYAVRIADPDIGLF